MTVKQDLEKALAAAEAAQGAYLMFAESTLDGSAKRMYQSMAGDVSRHAEQLRDRLEQLAQATSLPEGETSLASRLGRALKKRRR
jgi:rubrerythrin